MKRIIRAVVQVISVSWLGLSGPGWAETVVSLGPPGNWTNQACVDLYGESQAVVAMDDEAAYRAYEDGKIDALCVAVTTALVGTTPYMDRVLALKNLMIIAEYPKMLGYSLIGRSGATLGSIKRVVGHPVALEEVKPWLDEHLPNVARQPMEGGAQYVARSTQSDVAALGPEIGARIYGLEVLANHIEEGPFDVTRWWVLGKKLPPATGHDKTTLLAATADRDFGVIVKSLVENGVAVIDMYDRPAKAELDRHLYVIEIEGYFQDRNIQKFMQQNPQLRLLGSYPRKY